VLTRRASRARLRLVRVPESAQTRSTALAALAALVVIVGGATFGFAADPDASGERCLGCTGCAVGDCEDAGEDPLASHHHCCTTCCLSHAFLALPGAAASQALRIEGPMPLRAPAAVIARTPEVPYRPPRA
jgi:hypothetical protein